MTENPKLKDRNALADLCLHRGYSVGVEVGVFRAEFSAVLLQRSALRVLYLVDPWAGTGTKHAWDGDAMYADVQTAMAPYGERVRLLRQTSLEAAARFRPGELDFVYIDGLHDYESVKADIAAWRPLVRSGKTGGVLAGHDYSRHGRKGVIQAVTEAFGPGGRVHITHEHCPSWWVIM